MVKKYAYILDEHLGEVHFPLSAAQHMESSVNDLREKYQVSSRDSTGETPPIFSPTNMSYSRPISN